MIGTQIDQLNDYDEAGGIDRDLPSSTMLTSCWLARECSKLLFAVFVGTEASFFLPVGMTINQQIPPQKHEIPQRYYNK